MGSSKTPFELCSLSVSDMSSAAVESTPESQSSRIAPQDRRDRLSITTPRFKLPWLNGNAPSDQMPGSFDSEALSRSKFEKKGDTTQSFLERPISGETSSGQLPATPADVYALRQEAPLEFHEPVPAPTPVLYREASSSSGRSFTLIERRRFSEQSSGSSGRSSPRSDISNPFRDQPVPQEPGPEPARVNDSRSTTAPADPALRPYSSTQSLTRVLKKPGHRKWSSATSRPLNAQQTFTKDGIVTLNRTISRKRSQVQYTPSAYSSTPPSERELPNMLPRNHASSYERLVKKPSIDAAPTTPSQVASVLQPTEVATNPPDVAADKPPTWPMVSLAETEIEIPARGSSLTFLQPKTVPASKSSVDFKPPTTPSSLGRYNDGTISRQPTVRNRATARSPDVSPKTSPRASRTPAVPPQGDLERAVTGLQDLMTEALTVAKEAAHNNRADEVTEILDEATLALRKASTVHGHMTSPLRISESESSDVSSEEYISDSDLDADIESNISSMRPRPSASNVTVPTTYSTSKSGLSLQVPQAAAFPLDGKAPPSRQSIGGKVYPEHESVPIIVQSAMQPTINPPFTTQDGARPMSERGYYSPPSSSADRSIMPTPPRMYGKSSTDPTATDWAYVKRVPGRRDLRSCSTIQGPPIQQGDIVLPPPSGETTNIVLPPVTRKSRDISSRASESGSPVPVTRFDLPDVSRKDSLRPVRSSPDLPLPPPVPNQTPQPATEIITYPALSSDIPSKRYKPHVGASRIFESPYYRVQGKHGVPGPQPDESRSNQPPLLNATSPNLSLKHPRRNHISLRESQTYRLHRYRRQPIAREWKPLRKRITAAVACINTALVGLIAGIYAGEVPKIQYQMGDAHHRVILGNVVLFIGMGITTLIFWPLPLLHGRKPYTLGALAIAIPLQFPQAIAVALARGPSTRNMVGLLLPRGILGLALGFANINFLTTLFDLFGASLQSRIPHQEIVVYDDIRREGGGMGLWLGIWSWCAVGSMPLGFLIGAGVTQHLTPSWGFYIVVILLSTFILLNVIVPETRRAPYRRSVLRYFDEEEKIKRRVARGEIKLHLSQDGPKYWWEEVWAGMKLMGHMLLQPGFFILAIYLAWIYALVVLVTLLLGALLSRNYRWRPEYIGLSVFAVAVGALLAVPLSKANLFSRDRVQPARTDSMTFQSRITWTSHLVRRCLFTFALPVAGLAYVLASPGPSVNAAGPTIMAAIVGFLSCLAVTECIGLAMEAFDTSDLQPGVNTKHRLQSMESATRRRRTNYSSFPRVCAGLFAAQGLGFFLAAAATGVSGAITRALGAQAATGCSVGILLFLTIFLTLILWRFKSVQVIPNHALGSRGASTVSTDWSATPQPDEHWKPVVIGNPSGKMRRMNILECGAWSRWTEIRDLNLLNKQRHYVG